MLCFKMFLSGYKLLIRFRTLANIYACRCASRMLSNSLKLNKTNGINVTFSFLGMLFLDAGVLLKTIRAARWDTCSSLAPSSVGQHTNVERYGIHLIFLLCITQAPARMSQKRIETVSFLVNSNRDFDVHALQSFMTTAALRIHRTVFHLLLLAILGAWCVPSHAAKFIGLRLKYIVR